MEKELVKKLGQKIGYGNMMHLAAECWEEEMKSQGYPTSGVFIPALKSDVRGVSLKTWNERQLTIPDVSNNAVAYCTLHKNTDKCQWLNKNIHACKKCSYKVHV